MEIKFEELYMQSAARKNCWFWVKLWLNFFDLTRHERVLIVVQRECERWSKQREKRSKCVLTESRWRTRSCKHESIACLVIQATTYRTRCSRSHSVYQHGAPLILTSSFQFKSTHGNVNRLHANAVWFSRLHPQFTSTPTGFCLQIKLNRRDFRERSCVARGESGRVATWSPASTKSERALLRVAEKETSSLHVVMASVFKRKVCFRYVSDF